MKPLQLRVRDFDVAIAFYTDSVLMIIHNSIPGIGNIIYTEKDASGIECDQLLGSGNEILTLFAMNLARMLGTQSATFVFSFLPSMIKSFEDIRSFVDALGDAIKLQ